MFSFCSGQYFFAAATNNSYLSMLSPGRFLTLLALLKCLKAFFSFSPLVFLACLVLFVLFVFVSLLVFVALLVHLVFDQQHIVGIAKPLTMPLSIISFMVSLPTSAVIVVAFRTIRISIWILEQSEQI